MSKFYLDTDALKKYLKDLESMKVQMTTTVDQGLKLTIESKYAFDDAVYHSSCEHIKNIANNIVIMTKIMDKMSETAKQEHRAFTEYNVRVKL